MAGRGRMLSMVVVAAFLLGLTACGSGITAGPHLAAASDGSPAGSAPSASSLTETGSTLLFPLMRTWAAAYHQQFPDVTAWPPVRGALGRRGNNGVVAGCEAGQFVLPTAAAISASVASFVSLTPSNETISMVDGPAAHGYPIVNYEYAIVSTRQSDPVKARAIRAFLTWVITKGNSARYLNQVRFQPLPAAMVTLADQQIARIS